MNLEQNIWHTLAENALNGKYHVSTVNGVGSELPHPYLGYFNDSYDPHGSGDSFYIDMSNEEQCLFLLFCGESYEH